MDNFFLSVEPCWVYEEMGQQVHHEKVHAATVLFEYVCHTIWLPQLLISPLHTAWNLRYLYTCIFIFYPSQKFVIFIFFVFCSHFDAVTSVAFHPSDPVLVTGSEDCTVKVWNLQKANQSKRSEQWENPTHYQLIIITCTMNTIVFILWPLMFHYVIDCSVLVVTVSPADRP